MYDTIDISFIFARVSTDMCGYQEIVAPTSNSFSQYMEMFCCKSINPN
jgi:hypothetical protein